MKPRYKKVKVLWRSTIKDSWRITCLMTWPPSDFSQPSKSEGNKYEKRTFPSRISSTSRKKRDYPRMDADFLENSSKTSHLSSAWNPKQPFINGCFNWMIHSKSLYIENGCFTKHPLKNGCLGYQALKKARGNPHLQKKHGRPESAPGFPPETVPHPSVAWYDATFPTQRWKSANDEKKRRLVDPFS